MNVVLLNAGASKVYVNVDHFELVFSNGSGSTVRLSTSEQFKVSEPASKVKTLVHSADPDIVFVELHSATDDTVYHMASRSIESLKTDEGCVVVRTSSGAGLKVADVPEEVIKAIDEVEEQMAASQREKQAKLLAKLGLSPAETVPESGPEEPPAPEAPSPEA
jgi:hypothetical protein